MVIGFQKLLRTYIHAFRESSMWDKGNFRKLGFRVESFRLIFSSCLLSLPNYSPEVSQTVNLNTFPSALIIFDLDSYINCWHQTYDIKDQNNRLKYSLLPCLWGNYYNSRPVYYLSWMAGRRWKITHSSTMHQLLKPYPVCFLDKKKKHKN